MDCCTGPGFPTPLDAFRNGPSEKLLYVICVQTDNNKQDYLATIDVDPKSETYLQVIHRTYTGSVGDELHHSGWNVCSSCYDNPNLKRNFLILPALRSAKIFAVDVGTDPRKPKMHKVINGIKSANCSFPHTSHCLATGEIMISTIGDREENEKGDFVLVNAKTLELTGTWTKGKKAKFGYDFWYQPYHDVMVASEWGTPKYFKEGFNSEDVLNPDRYGTSINFYKWSTHELVQSIDLGREGCAPLEIRFLHEPKAAEGFAGCAVEANVFRFFKAENGSWAAEKVIDVPAKRVSKSGVESELNGLMGDILLSLDDKYLYCSCWLHGDVRQYDVTDPRKPRLTGIVRFGGKLLHDELELVEDREGMEYPKPVIVQGKQLLGGPQMLQLSLDGRRLYASNSLFSPWDKQLYPKMVQQGGWMVKIDVDHENGGMTLDPDFLVDFGKEPDGPVLAHEMRYPGGDCTSDIWLAKD